MNNYRSSPLYLLFFIVFFLIQTDMISITPTTSFVYNGTAVSRLERRGENLICVSRRTEFDILFFLLSNFWDKMALISRFYQGTAYPYITHWFWLKQLTRSHPLNRNDCLFIWGGRSNQSFLFCFTVLIKEFFFAVTSTEGGEKKKKIRRWFHFYSLCEWYWTGGYYFWSACSACIVCSSRRSFCKIFFRHPARRVVLYTQGGMGESVSGVAVKIGGLKTIGCDLCW